jgi:hypothetical protein
MRAEWLMRSEFREADANRLRVRLARELMEAAEAAVRARPQAAWARLQPAAVLGETPPY